jgi:hypothetical protein
MPTKSKIGLAAIGAVLVLAAVLLIIREVTRTTRPTNVSAAPVTVAQPASGSGAKEPGSSGEGQAPAKEGPDLIQLATVALYSCRAPSDPPAPPDGGSASKDQMITSNRETSKFNDDMNHYLDCLKGTSDSLQARYRGVAAAGELGEVEALFVRLNNAAVDRLQLKAKAFNEELRKYKARSPPPQ